MVRQYGLGVSPSGVTAERVPRHKGGSAVVRQYGLGVSPSGVTAERVPRHKATAVNCRQLPSTAVKWRTRRASRRVAISLTRTTMIERNLVLSGCKPIW